MNSGTRETTIESIGRDTRIVCGGSASKFAFIIIWQKIFKAGNEEKKNLSLELEEDGGHKGGERAQPGVVVEGARSSNPAQEPAPQGGFLFYFIFSFIFISWRLITLQYCSGFCHTLTWISHGFTCVPHPDPPSRLPPHPVPLGLPSAPAWALVSCIQPGLAICFTSQGGFLVAPMWPFIQTIQSPPQNISPRVLITCRIRDILGFIHF